MLPGNGLKKLNLFRCQQITKQYLVLTCIQYKSFENAVGKGEIARNEQLILFIRLSKNGHIMESPVAGRQALSSSLSGAYLQNYTSYGYEILWVDRSHQGGVQCV